MPRTHSHNNWTIEKDGLENTLHCDIEYLHLSLNIFLIF